MIDKDGSGSITSDEIRDAICSDQNVDPSLWDEMVMEVDLDSNGEVDFDEFKVVMRKMLSKPTISPLDKGHLGEDGLPKISESQLSDDLFDPAGDLCKLCKYIPNS